MANTMILPGAAGLLALTATMGFVDSDRETRADNFSRGRIALVNPNVFSTLTADHSHQEMKSGGTVYLVEIRRNEKLSKVAIDAATGRILKQTLISIHA